MTMLPEKTAGQQEILVVDDTPENLRLLTGILKEEGYRVRPATDGPLAMDSIAVKLPNLILLDVKMPEMDGYEVCRRLKADEQFRKIPVIFISALDDVEDKVIGFQAGGVDYITKPFNPGEVLARIRIHLQLCEMTDRLQAEKALRDSEERYRVLFEGTSEGILATDLQTMKFVYANPAVCRMLGYSEAELLNKTVKNVHPQEYLDQIYSEIKSSVGGEKAIGSEIPFLRKDGKTIYVDIKSNPIVFDNRNCSLAFLTDVTEQKLIKEKLIHSQQIEAIGTLAGGIAHDFNNILSAVIGYSEIALTEVKDNTTLRYNLQQVLKAGERAKELVQQILTFSRQSKQELKPLRIRAVASEALKLLRATLPSTVEFKQDFQSKCAVLADVTQIHQVIMNICTNAAHAMRSKGGVLSISLKDIVLDAADVINHPDLSTGAYVKMVISDTGCGMSKEMLGRVFEPFYTTKEKGEGTGMGLAVVHGIVKSHKGAISVYSEREKGTAFSVYFPIIEGEPLSEKIKKEKLPGGTERILFVDDEQDIVEIGCQVLESLGYHVVAKTGSREALSLFKNQPAQFDLIITDMTMPHLTGEALATKIMALRPGIPVILSTGFHSEMDGDKASELGIRAILSKPATKKEMAETVRKVLDGQ